MAITPANYQVFVSTASTLIGQAWADTVPTTYQNWCTPVSSSSTQEVYGWTGMLPKMRLWNGARVVFQAAPQTYTLVNQPFEGTLSIDQFALDDDQFGVYYRQLPDMVRQSKRQPDYMFRDLLENSGDQTGARQLGLDGLTGFNTAHPVDYYNAGAGTYSNDFIGGYTASLPKPGGTVNVTIGGALSPTSVMTMVEYMMTYKGEDGEALGVVPDRMMVATLLKGEAEMILQNQYFSPAAWATLTGQVGAAENPVTRWGVNLDVNPLLTNPYVFYMADTSRGFRGNIFQTRNAVEMVPRMNPQDPVVFDNHTFLWGDWARLAVGWGPSFLLARSGPS